MPLTKPTTIDKQLRKAMEAVDTLYTLEYSTETLNAILRIAQYASRQAASISTALLALEDTTDDKDHTIT